MPVNICTSLAHNFRRMFKLPRDEFPLLSTLGIRAGASQLGFCVKFVRIIRRGILKSEAVNASFKKRNHHELEQGYHELEQGYHELEQGSQDA